MMMFEVSRYEEEKDDEMIMLDQDEQNLQTYEDFYGETDSQLKPNMGRVKIIEKS